MANQNNSEIIALKNAKESGFYKIAEIVNRLLALKLMEMGCSKGMTIQKISSAPVHGPIVIKVFPNENLLALRTEDATDILLTQIEN